MKNADSPIRSFIVAYKAGVDPVSTTARLAKVHSFTPTHVWTLALNGFAAEFSRKALDGIRCEPEVQFIEHDAPVDALIQGQSK